jgi:hypothetical protein
MSIVRADLAGELEAFIAEEGLWQAEALEAMVTRLADEADGASRTLAENLRRVAVRSGAGPMPKRLTADIEGVLYPRLWKLMEAVWDGLPGAELRTRVAGLHDRLAPLLDRSS